MADESPAQRSARVRRERREAKIKEGGSARLDKITSLSGRTPQADRDEASSPQSKHAIPESPSPGPQTPQLGLSPSPQPDLQSQEAMRAQQQAFFSMLRQSAPEPNQGMHPDPQAPNSLQAQQEAFRTMLRQTTQDQEPGQLPADGEDPTIKLLNSLIGAIPGGDPNTPGAPPAGAGAGNPLTPGFSPAGIATMLGVPPFLANMLNGAPPPTEAEQKRARIWKTLHTVFALTVGVYLLFIIGSSVALFGSPPPKPATVQNPFAIFVTGELMLTGGKVLLGGKSGGIGMAVQLCKDVVRDGSLLLFILGMGTWYNREWQTTVY